MASIKAIKVDSIHQIQSGQVIVDLCSVVKELVENSLDAGASSVDVRFKNQGLDSIEVQDNGNGIAPGDFESVALKHSTSKLSDYEDLTNLDTFGFRGEALSSLCALSDFHIVTAQAGSGAKGSQLNFHISGQLKSTNVVASQKGTTVAVENLFKNLPVRRKELEKHVKREHGKVLGLLHAYACISVGVKFSVSNQMPKGKKVSVFSTKANPTTRENIVNVFGSKTLLALVKMDLKLEMEPSLGPTTQSARNWNSQRGESSHQVQVQGHISRPVLGEGRQAPDRQMFYVNSRPCGLPQVSKAFNEVYKSFNSSQSPFIFANLIMDTHAYDVNVSPDKRTIMLHDQTALLESLKRALTRLFEAQDQSMPASQIAPRKLPGYQPLKVAQPERMADSAPDIGKSLSSSLGSTPESEAPTPAPRNNAIGTSLHLPSPAGLIHNWVGRDAHDRTTGPKSGSKSAEPSKDKQRLANAMKRKQSDVSGASPERTTEDSVLGIGNTAIELPTELPTGLQHQLPPIEVETTPSKPEDLPQSELLSSPDTSLSSQPPPELPRAVQDFNARMQSQQARHIANMNRDVTDGIETPKRDQSVTDDEVTPTTTGEESILSITPGLQKSIPGLVQNAFDRMRPSRTPAEVAHITIGDKTMTTVIGTPTSKKRRVYEPKNSQSIAKFGASPLLARSLRNFAAAGSQLAADNDDEDMPDTQADVSELPDEAEDQSEDEDGPRDEEAFLTTTQALQQEADEEEEEEEDDQDAIDSSGADRDADDASPDQPLPFVEADDQDDEYLDEDDKKMREDAKVAKLIQDAEETAARPTEANLKRVTQVFKSSPSRKDATLNLVKLVSTSLADVEEQLSSLQEAEKSRQTRTTSSESDNGLTADDIANPDAEARLALTISKNDFFRMRIIGQFNAGFILAVRPSHESSEDSGPSASRQDHLFIIDQHAADEKFNFERLSRTTTLQPQRLVTPKPLELTAIEEEIILSHSTALNANGFQIQIDESGEAPVGQRCQLLSLPTSKETTFSTADLEELLHLLSENVGTQEIVRPTRVRRMLAMRACRSSIMVGKSLTKGLMQKVVRHMGEMEKPWNCPHGRPTMRHLAGLGAWEMWSEDVEWENGQGLVRGGQTDWSAWVSGQKDQELTGVMSDVE